MPRAYRQAAIVKLGEKLAGPTLVQIDGKRGHNTITQVR